MASITIEVPDELSDLIKQAGDRLPELLTRSLTQSIIPVHIYRYVLDFLANNPNAKAVSTFGPPPEMLDRLQLLLAREDAGELTAAEKGELDEYERLEHLMIMIKTGKLHVLSGTH